ncbi:hypothetical protein [Halobellus ordinarius]|uniref:hypothetical protein n=1 Tax=Halobellus ordinarius TaxID=3075120 RepID=UPI0028800B07|nr:hypothetical protein [Halobellus sp. ZY16]
MGASSDAPDEPSQGEHEAEVSRLRELEERVEALEALIGTLGDTDPEEADFKDITLAGSPAGVMLDKNNRRIGELQSAITGNGENLRLGGDREQMLPIHRMWGDLITGAGHALGETQERAARLYGEFVERVVNDEATKVDASGQMYTLTSGAAEEVLLGKFDEDAENLLSGVKKASRSQVIARAMRDVAHLSTFDDCDCAEIEECDHAEIRFRSGRPNVLAAPKQSFRESMAAVYSTETVSHDAEFDEVDHTPSAAHESDVGGSQ